MYRWCIAALSSGPWNIPTLVEQVLDRRTSRSTHCASSGDHPNSIQGRNPGTCCTCCVTKVYWEPSACSRNQITCDYHLHHDTAKHGYSGVVKESTGEWNDLLLSSLMRVSSVCMRVVDVRIRVWNRPGERRLPEYICPRHTDHTSGFMVWGASVTTRGHIWCSCRIK